MQGGKSGKWDSLVKNSQMEEGFAYHAEIIFKDHDAQKITSINIVAWGTIVIGQAMGSVFIMYISSLTLMNTKMTI